MCRSSGWGGVVFPRESHLVSCPVGLAHGFGVEGFEIGTQNAYL
jgi:hypothetical protein